MLAALKSSLGNVVSWKRLYRASSWVKCRPLIDMVLETYTKDLYLKEQYLSALPRGTGTSGSLLGLSWDIECVPRAKDETKAYAAPIKEASGRAARPSSYIFQCYHAVYYKVLHLEGR